MSFPSRLQVTRLFDCRLSRRCSNEGKYSCQRTPNGSWIFWMNCCGSPKPNSMTKSIACDVTRLLIYSFGSTFAEQFDGAHGVGCEARPRAAGDDGHAGLLDVVGACN